jgi:hypothetical protein
MDGARTSDAAATAPSGRTEREMLGHVRHDLRAWDDAELPRRRKAYKSFADKLSPAARWLEARVGRPWSKVKAEILAKLDTRSLAGRHIVYDHLLPSRWRVSDSWWVARRVFFVDAHGILRLAPRRQYVRPLRGVGLSAIQQRLVCVIAGSVRAPLRTAIPTPWPLGGCRDAKMGSGDRKRRCCTPVPAAGIAHRAAGDGVPATEKGVSRGGRQRSLRRAGCSPRRRTSSRPASPAVPAASAAVPSCLAGGPLRRLRAIRLDGRAPRLGARRSPGDRCRRPRGSRAATRARPRGPRGPLRNEPH